MRRFAPILSALALVAFCAAGLSAEDAAQASKAPTLLDMMIHGGVVMLVLIILSIICFSLSIQWTITMKRETFIPPGLADDIHNAFAEGVTDEAVENARNLVAGDTSMLGNILAGALDKKDFGYHAMKESAEAIGISEHNKFSSKVGWLSMFASSATLIGLFGTVKGIIGSFLTMGAKAGAPDPAALATSIGEALTCTAAGLMIAIIGLYFFYFLRARVNQAAIDAAMISSEVLDYFRPPSETAH